ncbi:MAG: DUF1801 domain-containing protein [Hyphomicrobiaceae bacterium]
MAESKTRPTDVRVADYLATVAPERRQQDARTLNTMMRRITGKRARMWGPSIVGYGQYHYKYDSGHEGDAMLTGFAPRKQNMVVYIMPGFSEYGAQLKKLGKHKCGKSCLYINKLDDVDLDVLEEMVADSVAWMKKKYGAP